MTAPENPWIEWKGGECPVEPDAMVEVQWLDGDQPTTSRNRAYALIWSSYEPGNHGTDSDIIAYRVIPS